MEFGFWDWAKKEIKGIGEKKKKKTEEMGTKKVEIGIKLKGKNKNRIGKEEGDREVKKEGKWIKIKKGIWEKRGAKMGNGRQRKNGILEKREKKNGKGIKKRVATGIVNIGMRNGSALLLVLAFVIIMAVIGAIALSFSGTASQHTRSAFMDVRAKLMARAGTEFALMAIEAHDFTDSCLKQVNLDTPAFDINMTFHYFMTNCGKCGSEFCSQIQTSETNGSVLIYTSVTPKLHDLFQVRTFRISIQNP